MLDEIDEYGFTRVDRLIDPRAVTDLIRWCEAASNQASSVARRGSVFARRNLLDDPTIRSLADDPSVRRAVDPILGTQAFPVRAILFDKTPAANWTVPWHQDRSIAVMERRDSPGFGPWSEKAGVVHVQPPVAVLQAMITVRIHLDECDAGNGPLRVIAGTHRTLLSADEVERIVATRPETKCCVPSGGAVLMRPLILHASSPSGDASHRRVVHIEYAAGELTGGLRWRFT